MLMAVLGGTTIEQSLATEEVPFRIDRKMCLGVIEGDLGIKPEVKIFRLALKEEIGDV